LAEYSRLKQVAKGVSVPFFSPQIIVVQSPAVELPVSTPLLPVSMRIEPDISLRENGVQPFSILPEPEKTKTTLLNQQKNHGLKPKEVNTVALVSIPASQMSSSSVK
jgi:hypothetical protein